MGWLVPEMSGVSSAAFGRAANPAIVAKVGAVTQVPAIASPVKHLSPTVAQVLS